MSYFSQLDTWLTEPLASLEPREDIVQAKNDLAGEIIVSYHNAPKARPTPHRQYVPHQS